MASILKAGRQVAMWSAGAGTAIPLILPTVLAEDKPVSGPCCQGKIKPSQLPIYDEPEDLYDITYHVSGKGQLQEGVEVVRKELEEALETTKELRDQVDHIYQTGKAHTAGQITYLREEENLPARAGAIAAGGLVGLLLGTRGRIIKKLLYTSVGAGATGAVLYPEHSKQYSQDLWHNANTYATVAYNFCVGVKPQVNGSGSGSQQTTATSPVDSSKSKSGVEVSNPYPSLLTLPYTTLFRKQESALDLFSREKRTKAGPSNASLDRMAEEASQVSMLGFRLQEAEKQVTGGALSGFGSVAQEDANTCKQCGKRKGTHITMSENCKATKLVLASASTGDSMQLRDTNIQNDIEISNKGIVDKIESISKEAAEFIDELKTGTEFVAEVSDKIIVGAETVEKVLETVATVASLAPVAGIGVAVALERAVDEAGLVVRVASEVKQVAEKTESVLDTVERVTEEVESFAEKVSDLEGDSLTTKEAAVKSSKKGAVEKIEVVTREATKLVDVIETGTELVAEISDEAEAGAKVVEKFAKTLENSDSLPPVVGAGVAILEKEAALVAGIAGKLNQAAENAEKVLDSVAEVVEKVETLAETVSNLEGVSPASGKEEERQLETNVASIADEQGEANSQRSIFDKFTSFFSPKKATESVPSKFIYSLASQQLQPHLRCSEVAKDGKIISPSQESNVIKASECLDSKIDTPKDFDSCKAPPKDEKDVTLHNKTLVDKRVHELNVVEDTKSEQVLGEEIVNMEDTEIEPEAAKPHDIVTASPENAIIAEMNVEKSFDAEKLVGQSKIDTKIYIGRNDANDQQNLPSEIHKFPGNKTLFNRLTDLFASNEPKTVPQTDTQLAQLAGSSSEMASYGLKLKVDVVTEPEAPNNQSLAATPTSELSSREHSDATLLPSQSRVLPTPSSEALSATTPLLETQASHSEIDEDLATQTEPTVSVTAAPKRALSESLGQESVLSELIAREAVTVQLEAPKLALPETTSHEPSLPEKIAPDLETVSVQETVLSDAVAVQKDVLPETVITEKTTLSEAVTAQETALPLRVGQGTALPETVKRGPGVTETVPQEHALPEIITQESTATTTHADQVAAAVPHKPSVTITQSEKDVIVSSEASSLAFSAELDAADPVIVAPLVRQLDGYTIIETPGTTEDVSGTREDDAAADSEVTTIKSASTSVSSKPGLYSHANESSKINRPTSAETKLPSPSAKKVSQSTMSDAKSRVEDSTAKGSKKAKDVVVRVEAVKKEDGEIKPEVDLGQSNPEDADMYTTRS